MRLLHNLFVKGTSLPFDLEWMSPIIDDQLVIAMEDATCLVDLRTNKLQRVALAQPSSNRMMITLESRLEHLVADLKAGDRSIQLRRGDFFHRGWLYTSQPFGRVSLDGKEKQAFPSPRTKYLDTFQPWEAFQVLGDRLLIANSNLPLIVVDPRDVEQYPASIDAPVETYTAGVRFIAHSGTGIQQMDNLGDMHVMLLRRLAGGRLDLQPASIRGL